MSTLSTPTLSDSDGRLPDLIDYPRDWPKLPDNLMSNFDHQINETVAKELKTVQATARYPGWGFHATCWWDGSRGRYLAAVRRFSYLVATYAAETPRQLMDMVCEDHGND
jgi:hypothetical protein